MQPGNKHRRKLVVNYGANEEALLILLADILGRLGYEIECARSGDEAIELYQKAKDAGRRFDIVLLDLTIPGGMGGKEVADRLKEIDDSVILIVSSGYSNTPIMSEFRSYGFDDVLSKPWTPVQLSEVLRRYARPRIRPPARTWTKSGRT